MPVTMGQIISLWEQAVLDGDRERAEDIRKEMVKIMRDIEKEATDDEQKSRRI